MEENEQLTDGVKSILNTLLTLQLQLAAFIATLKQANLVSFDDVEANLQRLRSVAHLPELQNDLLALGKIQPLDILKLLKTPEGSVQ